MSEDKNIINKYNNGKIYTIRCKEDNNLIYVGSTVQPLYKRWHQHKRKIKNENDKEYNKLLYVKIREIGIDSFYIELYENFKCDNIEQLLKREGEVIREIGNLNKKISGRTIKEYRKDNKEKIKQYYNENKEQYLEKQKQYIKDNKEQIKQKRKENKEQYLEKNKQFYNENKEQILEKQKQYYNENKEQINQRRRELYKLKKLQKNQQQQEQQPTGPESPQEIII